MPLVCPVNPRAELSGAALCGPLSRVDVCSQNLPVLILTAVQTESSLSVEGGLLPKRKPFSLTHSRPTSWLGPLSAGPQGRVMGPTLLMGFLWSVKFPLRFLTVTPEQSRESSVRGSKAARTRRRLSALAAAPPRARAPAAPRAPKRKSRSHSHVGVDAPDVPRLTARAGLRGTPLLWRGSSLVLLAGPHFCVFTACDSSLWRPGSSRPPAKASAPECSGQVRAHCSAVCSVSQACQEGWDPASLGLLGRHPVVSTEGPHLDSG